MERIGFIGLGLMGKPMTRNLLRAGCHVTVHNRSQAAVAELVNEGAVAAASPAAIAAASDIVITMLPDPQTIEHVIGGPEGLVAAGQEGQLIIDMSTSSPALARELAERGAARGIELLDAPVSGGPVGAESALLSIMVGGSDHAFERALPVLNMLGKNIVHVGGAGAGQITKAANQVIIALTLAAVSEGLLLVKSAGVDPELARRAMLGGFATSRVLEYHGARMLAGDFKAGSPVRFHYKDLKIAGEQAEASGAHLPLTEWVTALVGEMVQNGYGDMDHAALYLVMEQIAAGKGEWRLEIRDWRLKDDKGRKTGAGIR